MAEFQLSFKELGGREGETLGVLKSWGPITHSSNRHLCPYHARPGGGGHADTHSICPLGRQDILGWFFLPFHSERMRLTGRTCSGPGPGPPAHHTGAPRQPECFHNKLGVPDSCLTQSQMYRPIPDVGRTEASWEGLGQCQPPRGELGIATIKPQEFKFGNQKTPSSSGSCTASILMLPDTAWWMSLPPFTEGEAQTQRC